MSYFLLRYIANIEECIKEAIERVSSVPHLKIIKSVKTDKLNVRGDAYHLTECFANIFLNSIDALNIKMKNIRLLK